MARKDAAPGQRYACDHPGCGKTYSRTDHLLRHKLNHGGEKALMCDQCGKTFVRQDLLVRHLDRHALRGKTLGRWSAKRRMSSDSMAAASELGEGDATQDTSMSSARGEHGSTSQQQQQHAPLLPPLDRYETPFAYAPPPQAASGSSHGYGYRDIPAGGSGSRPKVQQYGGSPSSSNLGPPVPYDAVDHQGAYHLSGYARHTSNPRGDATQPSWDAHQQDLPQQHSSFGISPRQALHQLDTLSSGTTGMTQEWHQSSAQSHQGARRVGPPLSGTPFASGDMMSGTLSEANALLHSAVSGSSHFPFSAPTANDFVADYDWLFDGSNPLLSVKSGDQMTVASTQSETSHSRETQTYDDDVGGGVRDEMQSDDFPRRALESEQADALHDLAFFAILQRDIPDEPAFDVDAATHSRLLHFLSSVQELNTSPLFTPPALRCYLYLFFTKLNALHPLIHRPTFAAKSADPMLLSAMLVCGAHFADEAAHLLAERIGRKLWGAFISFEDFRPARATLALLQAMLLTETFGKMMGTRPQHETAHLFHNFIVTLARRNAVFVPSKVKLPHAAEERWRVWSREEEKKRISLYVFVLDAQHATIFRHVPALSSFQVHLHLPCDEDEWEARSAEEWAAVRRTKRSEPPHFITALKASLSPPDRAVQPLAGVSSTESFKHFVLLHGLMSVAYDLQWKQQALLTAPETSESINNWREKLMVSYQACMQRLDGLRQNGEDDGAGVGESASPLPSPSSQRLVDRASYSLIEWAQIVLHADPVDIQIYAGLPTVMGRFIDHHTFSVARKACREWARSEDARIAVWHAARFLQGTLLPESSGSAGQGGGGDGSAADESVSGEHRPLHTGFDELLHHQWVQYLCALVIWAYEQAVAPSTSSAGKILSRPRSQDQESNGSSGQMGGGVVASAIANPSLQRNATNQSHVAALAAATSSVPAPTSVPSSPWDRIVREASAYFSSVLNSDTHLGGAAFAPTHAYSIAVLELVERECRGSRWELGRESSGVLRKLIRERNAAAAVAVSANNTSFNATPSPAPTK